MTRLASMPLASVLDAFASRDPAPAGGSASALAAAAGTALLIMAATLPKTRNGAADEAAELAAAAVRLRPIKDLLLGLVDRDCDAYSEVLAAFRSPKATEAEQASRRTRVMSAMHLATEVPLETMRTSALALGEAAHVARYVSRVASADVAVALELLLAAVRGTGGSVDANLAGLKDEEYVARIAAERRQLEADSVEHVSTARAAL